MNNKQLAALFLCSLVPWTVGNGLVPLLPVYAAQLGASQAVAGFYLAFSYLAIALGALSAGWVSDGLGRRKLPLILTGIAGIPAAWLMGRVGTVWGLTALTALLWFAGGLGLALIGILTGMSAGEHERGKIFGILALTGGLGALVGGLGTGWLVENWGFTGMFNVLTIFLALWPLSALLVEDNEVKKPQIQRPSGGKSLGLGKSFYFLFVASIATSITGFFVVLTRSVVMSDLGFNALEISSTGAIGGLIALPLPVLIGWLSDRMGRKTFLFAGYLLALAALVMLAFSRLLWNFWIVLVLQSIAVQGNGTIGNALVTDMVPRDSLGKALALFGSTGWIGGVIGFGVAGYALQNLGLLGTTIIGSCLALVAIGLVIPVQVGSENKNSTLNSP